MALQRKGVLEGTFGTGAETAVADADTKPAAPSKAATRAAAPVTEIPTPPAETFERVEETRPAVPDVSATPAAPIVSANPAPRSTPSESSVSSTSKSRRRVVTSRAEELQRREDDRLRAAVEEAYKSAKRRPADWGTAPVRISADAKQRLVVRRAKDEETLGVKFAETHYMDVAISSVPEDPAEANRWVEDYLDTLGLKAPDTVGTTGRLRKKTSADFATISRNIRTNYGYGNIGHLQTAALLRLLDSLDRTDRWNEPGVVDLDGQ